MKIKLILQKLLFLILLITISCSNDSESEEENQTQELLIGEWLVISEHDYFCDSEMIANERFADSNRSIRFNEDGTYESFLDGQPWEAEDQNGTWENRGNGNYRFFYTVNGAPRSDEALIEFEGNDTMKYGIDDPCFESNGESLYTFTVWTRQ